jgi:signal transduction histidine kinase
VVIGPRRVGTARLGFDSSSLREALAEQKRHTAATAAVAVAIAILGTVLIVSWITRPLPKLAAAAREVGKGNFGVRVDWRSRDEIGMLARAFNDMAIANSLMFSAVKEEKEKLETIFNGTREGLVLANPKGGVLLVNAAARALLDWKGAEGSSFPDAVAAAKFEGPLRELLVGRARLAPFELKRTEPKLLILSGVADCLGDPADPSGYLFIFRDATLEKRGETLARNFLSLVSHKLRTPLAVALGYMEILEGDADLADFHKKAVVKTRQQGELLRGLVEKLITFSAVQSPASIVLQKSKVSLSDVVDSALKHLEGRLPGAEIAWRPSADAPNVDGDALLLRDAVSNFVENGVKFNKGPKKTVAIAVSAKGGRARVSVTDNGPGVPSEEQPKLFRKFYQIDDDFTGQIPGFGLGLAYAKNVVEAHGGTVGVDSKPGQGSTFWFELPLEA